MKRALTIVVLIAVSVYAGLCGLLYAGQRSMMYFPVPEQTRDVAEVIRLESEAHSIKVWHLRGTGSGALIYFGGNAEDVSANIPDFRTQFPEYSVYLVNYRGYGGSSGSPSEAAFFADAEAVHDFVSARHDEIAVVGRSIGSGVAVHLAATGEIDRLILVTPFDSAAAIAQRAYPYFPVSLILKDKYDSVTRVHEIICPTLLVIAGSDEIIPSESSTTLANAFDDSQIRVEIVQQATHNSISLDPYYYEVLRDFL